MVASSIECLDCLGTDVDGALLYNEIEFLGIKGRRGNPYMLSLQLDVPRMPATASSHFLAWDEIATSGWVVKQHKEELAIFPRRGKAEGVP